MILSVVKSEFIKLKRSPIWIAFFVLPIISAILGTFIYKANIEMLTSGWHSLWTQHSMFISYFFLPPLLGLVCAYEWRLEHLGNNWNSIMSQPITSLSLFVGKLIVSSVFAICALLFIGVLYFISGYVVGLRAFPQEFLLWISLGVFGSIAVIAVQLFLSMVIKSFAIPIGISLVGGFLGLAMVSKGMWSICPYALIAVGMNSNGTKPLTENDFIIYFISVFVFVALFISMATLVLHRKDIDTK